MTARPLVGLAGLPCAGKGTAAAMLERRGAHVIRVDEVGHAVLEVETVKNVLTDRFGEEVLNDANRIDRRRLGQIVFRDDAALADLEALVHPRIRERVRREAAAERRSRPVVLDAALLLPLGLADDCDRILLVEASFETRRERAAQRGWNADDLRRRDRRLRESIETLRQRADWILTNEGAPEAMSRPIDTLWKEIDHATQEEL